MAMRNDQLESGARGRAIAPGEMLRGERISLRLATLDDCTPRYEAWLADPEVNQFLETRWEPQTPAMIREFVAAMLASPDNYLFAIIENESGQHIGNIKLGPVRARHNYADISLFIGERQCWGRGYGSEAISLATDFGLERLGLDLVQAGLYENNLGSARMLEKAGYHREAALRRRLINAAGEREDHVWYVKFREDGQP